MSFTSDFSAGMRFVALFLAMGSGVAQAAQVYELSGIDGSVQYYRDGLHYNTNAPISDSDSLTFIDNPNNSAYAVDNNNSDITVNAPSVSFDGSFRNVSGGNITLNSGLVSFDNTVFANGTSDDVASAKITFNDGTGLKITNRSWSDTPTAALIKQNALEGVSRFVVENGSIADGVSKIIRLYNNSIDFRESENAMYNITGNGTLDTEYTFSQKSAAEIAAAGYDNFESATLKSMMSQSGNDVYDAISTLVQMGLSDRAHAALNAIRPKAAESAMVATDNISAVTSVANNRMGMGLAGGDTDEDTFNLIPWIQGMYNYTKNTQSTGFTGRTRGLAAGLDFLFGNGQYGLGYGRTFTRIQQSGLSSTRAYGNNFFAYGEYKLTPAYYLRGLLNYGRVDYHNDGVKWNVKSYNAQGFFGYIYKMFDSTIGMRYTYLDNDKHTSAAGLEIDSKDSQIITGVIGTKVSQDYALSDKWVLTPSVFANLTYDFKSAKNQADVRIGNAAAYQFDGDRLHKAGVEAGVGLVARSGNAELHLDYEGAFRRDNYSHTGLVKFKYNF